MEVGLSLPIKIDRTSQIEYVKQAEVIGFDHIWIGDNPPINNAFLSMLDLLNHTKTIRFWTGITSPLYYPKEVLVAISDYFYKNFEERFGLGLGIGNPTILKKMLSSTKHYSKFYDSTIKFIDVYRKRNPKPRKPFQHTEFPLAIGGLGEKMIAFAYEVAHILLLNSASPYDAIRAKLQHRFTTMNTTIIPYCMLQVLEENEMPSLTLWNITKDIAKSCSDKILKDHSYSPSIISQIRELPWSWMDKLPKGELYQIMTDFAIVGDESQVFTKLDGIIETYQKILIGGVVFGWIYSEEQWDIIKYIRNKFHLS